MGVHTHDDGASVGDNSLIEPSRVHYDINGRIVMRARSV